MHRSIDSLLLFCANILIAPLVATAAPIVIDTVPVGNAGNAGEAQSEGTFGAVAYNYRIGTTEVTVGQYTAFLNAVAATDTYALYNPDMATELNIAGIARSGVSGGYTYSVIGSTDKPVTLVNWGDAARFTNWLYNGQPTGAQGAGTTETGSYTLNGANSDAAFSSVTRNAGTTWVIPTENEWYKAAYHQPAANGGDSDGYWTYPMRTNSVPYSDQPPGATPDNTRVGNFISDDGLANGYDDGFAVSGSTSYSSSQNYLTVVGAYSLSPSFYGTFDQGGNVFEWNEALIGGSERGLRGGSWGGESIYLASSLRFSSTPTFGEFIDVGFRVAAIPEPSTVVLAGLGLLGIVALRWRRKR